MNHHRYSLLIPLGLACLFFYVIVGFEVLNPKNIAWLQNIDPATAYLGWALFRFGGWNFPLGLNPNYGLEISSSIIFSDSVPLLAFILKPFTSLLTNPFQYLGWWVLICFLMQAIAAWLTLGLFTRDRVLRALGCCFFLVAPPLLWRIGDSNCLVGQFYLLFSIYLVLRKTQNYRQFAWLALLSLSLLTHFYIFIMVLSLWFTDLLERCLIHKTLRAKEALFEVIWIAIILAIIFFQAGYLALGGANKISTGSYGIGKLNLLAPFNAQGWSYLLPDIPTSPYSMEMSNYTLERIEGFNYFGLGMIILLVVNAFTWAKDARRVCRNAIYQRPFFVLCCLGLLLFSISNLVSIGPINFYIPIPDEVRQFASILRSSARLFWPIFYLILLGLILGIIYKFTRTIALAILSLALLIQIVDTSAGWRPLRARLISGPMSQWPTPLQSPFWANAGKHYRQLVQIPLDKDKGQSDWLIFAQYAAQYQIPTTASYFAHYDAIKINAVNERTLNQLANGELKTDTLYILGPTAFSLAQFYKRPEDALANIDGFVVLAPGWLSCVSCLPTLSDTLFNPNLPNIEAGSPISFAKGKLGSQFLIDVGVQDIKTLGWGYPESFGVWAAGQRAQFFLPLPTDLSPAKSHTLSLTLNALVNPIWPAQNINLIINGIKYPYSLTLPANNMITIPITSAMLKQRFILIEIESLNPIKPNDIGEGDDVRQLSVGLVAAQFD